MDEVDKAISRIKQRLGSSNNKELRLYNAQTELLITIIQTEMSKRGMIRRKHD